MTIVRNAIVIAGNQRIHIVLCIDPGYRIRSDDNIGHQSNHTVAAYNNIAAEIFAHTVCRAAKDFRSIGFEPDNGRVWGNLPGHVV